MTFKTQDGRVIFNCDIDDIFMTSDTHFDHFNIINYCSRPFRDVNDMNLHLVIEWNKLVKPNQQVIHVGDFRFGYKNFVQYLNGNITLIKGNHDMRTNCFMDCFKSGILCGNGIPEILVKHKPNNHGAFKYLFHGHLHKDDPEYNKGKFFDVGVDMHNALFGTYAPFTLRYIMEQKGLL